MPDDAVHDLGRYASLGLGPVERETVQTRIHAELRAALMLGRMDPGQVLTIQGLAATFNVSALPVREALSRLVAENALELAPNRSVRVPLLDRDRLKDLCRARRIIEGAAAALGAPSAQPKLVSSLDRLVQTRHVSLEADGIYPALERNQEFHFALYRAAGSPVLMQAIESLWLQMGPYLRTLARSLPPSFGAGTEHHAALIVALRHRDAVAARDAIEADINQVEELLLRCPALRPAPAPRASTARRPVGGNAG
jgi:DNA-binding GntR family transcriptional regulator